MNKVKSGDPLAIPAATFNTFVDAARAFLGRQCDQGQAATPVGSRFGMVMVQNAGATDAPRFCMMRVYGGSVSFGPPAIDPDEYGIDAFAAVPIVKAVRGWNAQTLNQWP